MIMLNNAWSDKRLVQVGTRTFADLNPLGIRGFLGTANGRSLPRGAYKDYCLKRAKDCDPKLQSLAETISRISNKSTIGSRSTPLKNIWRFLLFQYEHDYHLGENEGINEFIIHLKNLVATKEIQSSQATGILSTINTFLIQTGKINKKYNQIFSLPQQQPTNYKPYRKTELKEMINYLFSLYDQYERVMHEHIEKTNNGTRQFPITTIKPIIRYITSDKKLTVETLGTPLINTFMSASFYIFTIFTWANKQQVIDLNISDIQVSDKGMESDFVFKGRAHKFVRYNIGTSSIDSDRSGLNWFKRFVKTRKILKKYLSKHEGIVFEDEMLFFFNKSNRPDMAKAMFRGSENLGQQVNQNPLKLLLEEKGYGFSAVNPSRIRKTMEQLADQKIANPFVIMTKAQHEWGTYKNNYSKGNPADSKEEMAAALKLMQESGVGIKSFSERKVLAKEKIGATLVNSGNVTAPLLNGFGCNRDMPQTEQEQRFLKQQHKFGRDVKVCADFSSCVDCQKCVVIDQVEAIYNLLSFRHKIAHGKPVYAGSTVAKDNYELLLTKIDMRLEFVDRSVLDQAKYKLRTEGVAIAWEM